MRNIIIILALFFSSCSLEYRVMRNEPYVRSLLGAPDSIFVKHDSIVTTEISAPDSGFFYAYLICDSLNNVLIQRIETGNTAGVKVEIKYKDRYIKFDFKTDSARIAKHIIENYVKEKIVTIQVDKPATLEKLAKFEQKNTSKNKAIWILSGVIAVIIIGMYVLKRLKIF